jgi:hypothetical protein
MSQLWKTVLGCVMATTVYLSAQAQESCGFEPTPEQIAHFDRTRVQRQQFSTLRSGTIHWIPIQFYEGIATSGQNATPRMNYEALQVLMKDLNQFFGPYNIQFFECDVKKDIANNTLFGFDSSEEPQLSAYETPNVLNVYFFHTVSVNGAPVCGYSYLPPSADRVFVAKGCTDDNAVFLHEIGHYFGLYHTHGKTNSFTDELVNGSNCTTAGDEICDTPADPRLNISALVYGCNYIGAIFDANGDAYRPDPTNLMSYAHTSCKNRFTPQQMARMAYTALNDRANLTGCTHPNDCQNQISSLPVQFDFETGMQNWSNGWFYPEIRIDFIRHTGATPTPNTGPDTAYSGSHYVYLESSADTGNYYRLGVLQSPCFDLRAYTAPKMSLRYHAFGNNLFELGALASIDGGATWDSLLFVIPQLSSENAWKEAVMDLSPFITAPNVQFRILASMLPGGLSDIALDDIRVYNDAVISCNLNITTTLQSPSCNGGSNGQILPQVSGGVGNLTYSWSNGASSTILEGLSAGTYSLVVLDSLGCKDSVAVTLLAPPALQVNLSPTHVGAPGQSNGAISSTVSGGTAPYYYTWSNGATSANLSALPAGTYTVTVIDSKDCQLTRAVTLTEPVGGCGTLHTQFPWAGGFENNFLIFERVLGNSTNWVRRNSATPNPNTGPSAAYEGTFYTFINSAPNRTAVLQTYRCLDLRPVVNPVMEFYYHMLGAQMGQLNVDVSTNNGVTWTTVWTLSGNQGDQWRKATINLQPYNNGTTRIRFRGISSSSTSDMALDALYIGPATGSSNQQFNPQDEEALGTIKVNVFPNPAPGIFNFFAENAEHCSSLEVYNPAGQKIWKSQNTQIAQQIDLSYQPEGIYFLRALVNGKVIVKKLMIARN